MRMKAILFYIFYIYCTFKSQYHIISTEVSNIYIVCNSNILDYTSVHKFSILKLPYYIAYILCLPIKAATSI